MLIMRENPHASRKTRTLDELLLEIEQMSQERDSSARVSDEPYDEEENDMSRASRTRKSHH